MRAAYYSKPGKAAEVIEIGDVKDLTPQAGEVLVKVHASGVNPFDIKLRTILFDYVADSVPVIPHNDGAGIIEAGGDDASDARAGERVWLRNAMQPDGKGTAAEYVVVKDTDAWPLPEKMNFAEGACLGVPLVTAAYNVYLCGDLTDKTVLISGGAGVVGNYAIQLAKIRGARVLTTVSTKEKFDHAAKAGADEIINYKEEDVAKRINALSEGNGVDFVIEANIAGNAKLLPDVTAAHGTVMAYGSDAAEATVMPNAFIGKGITMKFTAVHQMTPDEETDVLNWITGLLEDDRLSHTVGKTFSLDDTAKAQDAVENRDYIGKVVVEL